MLVSVFSIWYNSGYLMWRRVLHVYTQFIARVKPLLYSFMEFLRDANIMSSQTDERKSRGKQLKFLQYENLDSPIWRSNVTCVRAWTEDAENWMQVRNNLFFCMFRVIET